VVKSSSGDSATKNLFIKSDSGQVDFCAIFNRILIFILDKNKIDYYTRISVAMLNISEYNMCWQTQ